jgi:FkbM family methyltransferase
MAAQLRMRRLLKKVTHACLPQSAWLAEICLDYLNFFRGEDIGHPRRNGEARFQKFVLPKASVCFDVGANKGEWTLEALRLNPTVQVHCFEPARQAFEALRAAAWPAGVTLNHLGLSDTPGSRTLHLFKNPKLNSLHARAGLAQGEVTEEQVTVTTLDDYVRTRQLGEIDFLKIDVEGEELRVLRGARELFAARRVRFAQVEYGGTYIDARVLFKDVFAFAVEHGYSVYQLHPRGWRHYPQYDPNMENFRMKNFILARDPLP